MFPQGVFTATSQLLLLLASVTNYGEQVVDVDNPAYKMFSILVAKVVVVYYFEYSDFDV